MITVLSISPTTIRIVCDTRRGMLRSPIVKMIRLRRNTNTEMMIVTASNATSTIMIVFIGIPKRASIAYSPPGIWATSGAPFTGSSLVI
jgi:hypothetical protein